jgi:hypothetical protein
VPVPQLGGFSLGLSLYGNYVTGLGTDPMSRILVGKIEFSRGAKASLPPR